MIVTVYPARLRGVVPAISSKSYLHRLLFCAALCQTDTHIRCRGLCDDIRATISALAPLGKEVQVQQDGLLVRSAPARESARVGESGTTFRFALSLLAAARQCETVTLDGAAYLAARPISPLYEELVSHGAVLSQKGIFPMRMGGRLQSGCYRLPGNVSSQFLSGLLLALPLCHGESAIVLDGPLQSAPYVEMTLHCLRQFGIQAEKTADGYRIPGDQRYVSPGTAECPGDFSNAAFFLAAGALSPEPVGVAMALPQQVQGDSAIVPLLVQAGAIQKREGNIFSFQKGEPKAMDISASDIPDLVPILSLYAAAAPGVTRIRNAQRLRLKESDRLQSVCRLLTALGADVQETPDGLLIKGGVPLRGGTVDSCNDHRIAMTAAIAACVGSEPVTIRQFEAVNKSYPDFLRDLALLGGRFCQEE